ncbi:MAG TPA: type II secretion system F family protein [Vicinamibacterales bacterium]|nr:type II secretion system F family protein [Vicinamibacterales bacterium]
MGTLILVLLVFLFGVGAVMAAYFGVIKLPGIMLQRKLDSRLQEVTAVDVPEEERELLVKERHAGPLPGLDRFASGTAQGSALAAWIEQSGVQLSISALFLISVGLAVLMGLIVASAMRMMAGWVVGGILGFAMPFMFLKIKRTRRMRAFEEAFPEALDLVSRALKAGHAFATGMKMVADEMPDPVGTEFRKAFDEQNFGLPLKDALSNMTVRMPSLDVRFFATAVLIQRETGGNLSEILENLAHVVRERFKILRQVRVYTAHGRLTGYVLLGLPVFLAIALAFINPEHMQLLFQERLGHMMLGATVIMQTVGYFWIKQVVKIEV